MRTVSTMRTDGSLLSSRELLGTHGETADCGLHAWGSNPPSFWYSGCSCDERFKVMEQQARSGTGHGTHISVTSGFGGVRHMRRHVDRMLYEEATRIILGHGDAGGKQAASSFMTEEAATVILGDLIASRQDKIDDWLRDSDTDMFTISKQYGKEDIARLRVPVSGLGLVVDRVTWKIWVAKSSRAVAVLRRDGERPAGYEVVTMFPAVHEPEPSSERLDVDPLPYLMASPHWARLGAVRREGFALMCDHGELPIHYDRYSGTLMVPAMQDGRKVGRVLVGASGESEWTLDGCSPATLPYDFARAVMRVAFPEAWEAVERVYRGIEKYRYDKFLEGKRRRRSFVVEPFLPDIRIREIMSEANEIIREAELSDEPAVEDAEATTAETESRDDAGRRRGERLASRTSERDRQEAERHRRQRESQLERARRKSERKESKASEPHAPAPVPAADDAWQKRQDAVPYEWRHRIVTPSIASLGPLEYWHVPLYDPDTNDVLVTMVGVLDRIATGADGSEVLAGLVLHADAGDIDATFERMAELNEDGLRLMRDARRRVTEGRPPDGEVTMLDERSGYPVAGGDGLLHVNDADRHEAWQGRDSATSVFCPQWWDEVGERPRLVVETPFPKNLVHLVEEGRYDVLTLRELDRLRNGSTEWLPIAHADVTMRLGIQATIDDGPARPSHPASWSSDKSELVSSDSGARILTLPAFCTKAVPDIAYWNDEEMLVALVAEAVAQSAEDGMDGSPMAPGQADTIPCFEDLIADCGEDPRERLRAMMALGAMMDAGGMLDHLPLLAPSQIITSFIEADGEYEAWRERFGRLDQDGGEDGMSFVPTTRQVSRQKVIVRRA